MILPISSLRFACTVDHSCNPTRPPPLTWRLCHGSLEICHGTRWGKGKERKKDGGAPRALKTVHLRFTISVPRLPRTSGQACPLPLAGTSGWRISMTDRRGLLASSLDC